MTTNDQIRTIAADRETTGPTVGDFLNVLAQDIEDRPERVKPIDPSLVLRIAAITQGADSDVGTDIDGEVVF